MKVTLLQYTPEPEKLISCAAKLCYSNNDIDNLYDGLTKEKTDNFIKMLEEIGHESPIEHVCFTFGIEGVSRSLLAQITRHRIASFSVQSQRYVKIKDFKFVTPPQIACDKELTDIYNKSMSDSVEHYQVLANKLEEKHIKTFLEQGMSEKDAKRSAEKKAIEDARFVLPNAAETKMVVTMNARSLNNFFRLRCCNRAQWEIKNLADEMLNLVKEVAPTLFRKSGPPCLLGKCPEGKMSCGKINEIKAFYGVQNEG